MPYGEDEGRKEATAMSGVLFMLGTIVIEGGLVILLMSLFTASAREERREEGEGGGLRLPRPNKPDTRRGTAASFRRPATGEDGSSVLARRASPPPDRQRS